MRRSPEGPIHAKPRQPRTDSLRAGVPTPDRGTSAARRSCARGCAASRRRGFNGTTTRDVAARRRHHRGRALPLLPEQGGDVRGDPRRARSTTPSTCSSASPTRRRGATTRRLHRPRADAARSVGATTREFLRHPVLHRARRRTSSPRPVRRAGRSDAARVPHRATSSAASREGAFRAIDPVLGARAFIGMVVDHLIVRDVFGQRELYPQPPERGGGDVRLDLPRRASAGARRSGAAHEPVRSVRRAHRACAQSFAADLRSPPSCARAAGLRGSLALRRAARRPTTPSSKATWSSSRRAVGGQRGRGAVDENQRVAQGAAAGAARPADYEARVARARADLDAAQQPHGAVARPPRRPPPPRQGARGAELRHAGPGARPRAAPLRRRASRASSDARRRAAPRATAAAAECARRAASRTRSAPRSATRRRCARPRPRCARPSSRSRTPSIARAVRRRRRAQERRAPARHRAPGQPLLGLARRPRKLGHRELQGDADRRMQPGDAAEIRVDAFPDRTLRGHVESISPATGAKYALLPPEQRDRQLHQGGAARAGEDRARRGRRSGRRQLDEWRGASAPVGSLGRRRVSASAEAATGAIADLGARLPTRPARWLLIVGVMLAVILEILDTSIVNVALPTHDGKSRRDASTRSRGSSRRTSSPT